MMFNQAYFGFDNYSFAQQNGYARSEFTDWTKSMKGKAGKKVRKPISIFSTFDIDSLFSVVKSVFSEKNTKSFAERNWDVLMIGLAAFAKLSTMGATGLHLKVLILKLKQKKTNLLVKTVMRIYQLNLPSSVDLT
jgi:hypothetical protein